MLNLLRIDNLYEFVVNEAQNTLNANAKTDVHQMVGKAEKKNNYLKTFKSL